MCSELDSSCMGETKSRCVLASLVLGLRAGEAHPLEGISVTIKQVV